MALLKRLFGSKNNQIPDLAPFEAPLAPDLPFFAVGDVHGCLPQLRKLQDQIKAQDNDAPVVYVGDYVDRGEDSAGVLRTLFEMREDPKVVCLAGNHEEMMLDFIDEPVGKGERWLRYGGLQTMASFGVGGVNLTAKGDALVEVARRFTEAMPPEMLAWLRDLPSMWQSGNVAVVHAGADPAIPIALQGTKTLAWGHRNFQTDPRQDGIWVLHGHTIVDTPYARDGRIAVDTGAYATGQLTAAYVQVGDVDFLST